MRKTIPHVHRRLAERDCLRELHPVHDGQALPHGHDLQRHERRRFASLRKQAPHGRGTGCGLQWHSRQAMCFLAVILLSALLGCTSAPRRMHPPVDAPAGSEWIQGAQNVQLYTSVLLPVGEPLGVVYLVLGPEVGTAPLYPKLTAALLREGFAVMALHPRGTGYSTGLRGDLDDFRLFLADHHQGLGRLRERFGTKPIFVLGQSVGAAFALELAATAKGALAGMVLVNPAYQLRSSQGMTPSFSDYVAFAANSVFRPSALTVDMNSRPAAIEHPVDRAEALAMQADPLVVRHFSMRFMMAQQKVMSRCPKNAAATKVPLLLVQGAQDALVDPRGTDEILTAAGSPDKTKRVAPQGGHGTSAVESQVEPIVYWLLAHR